MPPLRKFLKYPGTYLAILALLAAVAWADSSQSPNRQLTSRVYIAVVRGYQSVGMRKGLAMSAARLWRCRKGVPLGTADPVP